MTWETGTMITREEAITRIKEMAKAQGIAGAFKVFYDDAMIANPNDLPAQVDMGKVKVSAVLDNAIV
jgi:hypothetical protein